MFEILQCSQYNECRNSVEFAGESRSKCAYCRLAPGNEQIKQEWWRPTEIGKKHLQLVQEKKDKEYNTRKDRIAKRQGRDQAKMKISWKSTNSEKSAEERIVKATKNSGRSNRDGDLQAGGFIGLDNKLQTKNVEPVVHLDELDKAIADAKRGGMLVGGLVIETKNGVSVTVFKTEDFAKYILSRLV